MSMIVSDAMPHRHVRRAARARYTVLARAVFLRTLYAYDIPLRSFVSILYETMIDVDPLVS